ncbi:MAG TPA: alanine--tRNA ligase [Gammaproteobacteria bacterium]|nr:alanine--tRNA ligase [Gammaproteobacteria bacterium]
MTSNEIRKSFLDYFKSKGHTVVASSPLVPGNDPTLLFTNAGMVQFKDVFLGRDRRGYSRAASSQRCVRAGGKHNDLENVGYTARHHTFFEMLGNFSFGDYFKRDAIVYAWELLTKVWKLPPDRLWVTVYATDDEAYEVWAKDVGVPKERIVRIGDKPGGQKYQSDNFWQMADTGPCGPCSEVFWDHGPGIPGGPPGSTEAEGDRYVEIWNLVFMQFDRSADGVLTKLPKPCVDTGMGLERVAAVMQKVHSNYDIDLFKHLLQAAASATHAQDLASPSLRVIADHIRACAFMITDGVLPSNEGRGYVLRRIIRRAIRHGYKLGQEKPFFHKLVAALDEEMGEAYPELHKAAKHVEKVLLQEEERFAETLQQGMGLLDSAIKGLKGKTIPGETVFKLYDTYGFPADLTNDIARERGLTIDSAGFEKEMDAQRERGRAASQFGADYGQDVEIEGETAFKGYETLAHKGKVTALFRGKDAVQKLSAGEQGMVILDQTPFYAESGGQVGDQGVLKAGANEFKVVDTQKRGGGAHAHLGTVTRGEIKVGDAMDAQVDAALRAATVLNHSATHLLHAALRQVLGTHVTQKGSLVAPDRLRFDFSHYQAVAPDELEKIETLVNDEVRRNEAADVREMGYDEAIKFGAMALFGEKYGSVVRVMKFGDFSTELCGGTHVHRTGDIGLFKIVSEGGIAAGVRRIEALTGAGALGYVRRLEDVLRQSEALLRTGRDEVVAKTEALLERNKQLEKQLAQASGKLAANRGDELSSQAQSIGSAKVLAAAVDGVEGAGLRDLLDQLKNKLGSAVIVLGASAEGRVSLIAGVTSDLTSKVKAGELVNMVAQQVGGKGGGRPDMAQAGGNDPSKLEAALKSVPDWVRGKIS